MDPLTNEVEVSSENKSTSLNQMHTTVSLLLLPFDQANSTQPEDFCASNLQAKPNHSMCFWSDKEVFRNVDQFIDNDLTTTMRLLNANPNDQKDPTKIKCTRPLALGPFEHGVGCAQSQFDLNLPNRNFTKKVKILFKPNLKEIFGHKIIVMLSDTDYFSKIAFWKFLAFNLKNPGVSLLDVESETATFKSSVAFSNETMRFINESCSSEGWKQVDPRFPQYGFILPNTQQVEKKLQCSKKLASIWNGSNCPIQTQIYTLACM